MRNEYDANQALASTPVPASWAKPAPKRVTVRKSFFARLFGL